MGRVRSPLRFPGGKSRVVDLITPYFPQDIDTLISPFFGGGGIELWAAQKGIRVYGYDGFKPLAAFWERLLDPDDAWDLIKAIQGFFPLSAVEFRRIQAGFGDDSSFSAAVLFFVLNRASFSGTTMSGGCGKTPSEGKDARFTQSSIDRLKEFALVDWQGKLSVDYSSWPDTLAKHPTGFAYIDPPYFIAPKIYGVRGDMHRGFDHEGLALALKNRKDRWAMSYNDCDRVRELYADFDILPLEWTNSMGGNENGKAKKQSELLIRNYK